MRSVWKYDLKFDGVVTHNMPEDAQILHAAMQGNQPVMWALVETGDEIPSASRQFLTVGTGFGIRVNEELKYVGTLLHYNGEFVQHVFEVI
jgi:hypothetical protein